MSFKSRPQPCVPKIKWHQSSLGGGHQYRLAIRPEPGGLPNLHETQPTQVNSGQGSTVVKSFIAVNIDGPEQGSSSGSCLPSPRSAATSSSSLFPRLMVV
ncbi:hypothetical protein J3458_004362 [Metarhizium acridum]|uniref:uncharacterized protein n=1 Tax=Metarhizium acridum TaxID=92637 RepID=UPI001C6B38D0|nr:hypothetical protein J3458_004362 [Metarhizium acridum]